MKALLLIVILMVLWSVEASKKTERTNEVRPRGKGKYALITNLAIVLAAKVGLYKLILAIALTVASAKILLIMVWAMAIYKYVPDPYLHYKKTEQRPFGSYQDTFAHHREVHFFYVVATKLIVLKMVYGALFYVLVTKGWQFVLWFIHYLKEKKHEHHEYIDDHHFDHFDHDHGHYGNVDHSYGNFDHSYGQYDHQPYGFDKYGYGSDNKKRIYDADGSFSIKGQ